MNEEAESGTGDHPHVPVMVAEVMHHLAVRPTGTYVDCTAGYGGHAERIAAQLRDTGRLVAIDRDETAVEYVEKRLGPFGKAVTVKRANFSELAEVLAGAGVTKVDGVLFDLGTSVPQLRDDAGRGFSFAGDAPLDMRMDRRQSMTAAEVVNRWPETELAKIFHEYSDERYSRAIARAIVHRRKERPIDTTAELAELVIRVVTRRRPKHGKRRKMHPATRVFQAVRMAVNDEIGSLRRGMEAAADALGSGGILCAISFHSVEHRAVKVFLRERARPCSCPPGLAECLCRAQDDMKIVNRRALRPTDEETAANPHARSAQLRVGEKR
jgi:16S rRNA (cytosine1402-N4)-methyltransferase